MPEDFDEPMDVEPIDDDEQAIGGVAVLPGFLFGGRVDRTGIALVHEGEHIVPAPGSGAVVSPYDETGVAPMSWSFPVEVEVVGTLSETHLRAVAKYVFDELDTALRGLG